MDEINQVIQAINGVDWNLWNQVGKRALWAIKYSVFWFLV